MKIFSLTLVLLFAILGATRLDAQIQVSLEMDRQVYVTHEPITGTLTIVNRAGKDLIFGNTGGLSWLDFTVTDTRGALITPVRNALDERPINLASGQTYKHKVTVNRYYPMANIGLYRVKASVTFPQINRVFQTQSAAVQVIEGQAMWSQIVGLPPGHPREGTYREYSLMTFFHGARARSLYFQLKDNDTGMVYKTYPIGDYMSVRKPVPMLDKRNQLHVLHMVAPQKYKYTVINVDGEPVVQENYWAKGENRPELRSNDFGDVALVGGLTQEEMSTPYEQTQFRRLSERPPGLPNL